MTELNQNFHVEFASFLMAWAMKRTDSELQQVFDDNVNALRNCWGFSVNVLEDGDQKEWTMYSDITPLFHYQIIHTPAYAKERKINLKLDKLNLIIWHAIPIESTSEEDAIRAFVNLDMFVSGKAE